MHSFGHLQQYFKWKNFLNFVPAQNHIYCSKYGKIVQLTESCIFLKGFLAVETFGIITLFPDFTSLCEIVYILMAKLTGRKFSLLRIILEHKVYFKKINAKLSRFKNNFHRQKKLLDSTASFEMQVEYSIKPN